MKNIKCLVVLAISICILAAGCGPHEVNEFKTYSNVYYTLQYPSNWQDPVLNHSKVVLVSNTNKLYFSIHQMFYEGSLQDLIPEKEYEECVIDGVKGYVIENKEGDELYTFYVVPKNDMIFEFTFISQDDGDKNQETIDQLIESFEFNNFKSMSFGNWNKYSTENIEVYYPDNSNIYDEVTKWSDQRQNAFNYICEYLDVQWDQEPIKMFVFNSQEHGQQYGIQLGFAWSMFSQIYTLDIQTKGHELSHCISYHINSGRTIDSDLIEEGLATHLDMTGRDFHQLAANLLREKSFSITLLGDKFREHENAYTFGASFVKYLIDEYSLDLFKEFYAQNKYNEEESFKRFYNKDGSTLINEWIELLKTY